jgi:23S rRNA (adenine2503-C2)-methyltransferase
MLKKILCGLTSDEIRALIEPCGFGDYHALSISNSIYKKGISDIQKIPGIPKKLKELLSDISETGLTRPVSSEVSADGSVKYLFCTASGKTFETVYIPEEKRHTVCVSSQSGCKMGCSFCRTARYGFKGNLTVEEILNQIISIPCSGKITHVVFMGMGEPMDNLENVLKACSIITSESGLALGAKNITVSTVGILPRVEEFLARSECNLTLSLYSPFKQERRRAIPAEERFPADSVISLMKRFKLKKKRRLSVAYLMMQGINDTDDHLEKLISVLSDSDIRVNLLPYHPVPDDHNTASSPERMQYFKHSLVTSGISASIRKSRGADISAACGLLASGMIQDCSQ